MGILWCFCKLGCFSASYGRPTSCGMMKMQLRPENLGGGGASRLHLSWLPGKDERYRDWLRPPSRSRTNRMAAQCSQKGPAPLVM